MGGPDYPAALAIARDAAMGRMVLSGLLSPAETLEEIRGARFLIFPSRWYEPFGMALLEAAACGVPAIASRIGGIPRVGPRRRYRPALRPGSPARLDSQSKLGLGTSRRA